jgi:hypothetical protein
MAPHKTLEATRNETLDPPGITKPGKAAASFRQPGFLKLVPSASHFGGEKLATQAVFGLAKAASLGFCRKQPVWPAFPPC